MKLYNTLGRQLEEFQPQDHKITYYQCGPTVYSTQHIGNMRAMYVGDIIFRTLKYLFPEYDIKFVRNYTDVGHLVSDEDNGEDKMERGAAREGITVWDVAQKYINQFDEDIKKLNTLPPTLAVRATNNIEEQKKMVKVLLDKGFAYVTNEAVYFDTTKATDYTRLSGQKLEENIEKSGHGDDEAKDKRNPADFVLWFFRTGEYKNHQMHWDTKDENGITMFYTDENPDGDGFPGWHIECSSIIKTYLGGTIDIHEGGVEHIPVHHTNEIAQSENANDQPFVRYWLHHEHLLVDGGKMSKSGGTSYVMKDLEEKGFTGMDLRYFFLNAHYKSQQNFTWDALEAAKSAYNKLKDKIYEIKNSTLSNESNKEILEKYSEKFNEYVSNDFNVSGALATLWEVLKEEKLSNQDKFILIEKFDQVLGLDLTKDFRKENLINEEMLSQITELIEKRNQAKNVKDYILADQIRAELTQMGIELMDTSNGTEWKLK